MMVALSDDARDHLERYLKQVRTALRGQASVDADEVERDVRTHVDAELSGQPEPVDATRLGEVLDRLGAPGTWAPADDPTARPRLPERMLSGLQRWGAAWLAFALFVLGPLLFMAGPFFWPLELFLIVGSAFTARASLALLAEAGEPVGARRWLIYPPLIVWSLVIVLALLLGPLPLLGNAVVEDASIRARIAAAFAGRWSIVAPAVVVAGLGIWWAAVGLFLGTFAGAVRAAFWPFAEWFDRRHGMRVALAGILISLASGGVLMAFLR
jgi:hypothetical protein